MKLNLSIKRLKQDPWLELEKNYPQDKEIYGEEIMFSVGKFIREIMNFPSMQELKLQIEKDILLCVSV